jgi:hypothetical protein
LFRELFPWPDAVIDIRPDGSDVLEIMSELQAEPERRSEINRRNASEALLRHDWIHRWLAIFEIAGIEPSEGMKARVAHLKERAQLIRPSSIGGRLSHADVPVTNP